MPFERIDALTPAELVLALDQDLTAPVLPARGRQFRSSVDRDEYIAALRRMTPQERLRFARDG